MTTLQLIDHFSPRLSSTDTVEKALQMTDEFKLTHLPVVDNENFLGLISQENLMNEEDKNTTLHFLQQAYLPAIINGNSHFLKAVAICNLYHTNIIAVTGENNEFLGTISSEALLTALGSFCGAAENGAIVVLDIERSKFSISEINSIVESDGSTILHLNVAPHVLSHLLEVTLQINKKEVSTIIATFERYEYSVTFYSGEELFENEISTNYNHLMNYLSI
jgi:predicted transcriptional regulator